MNSRQRRKYIRAEDKPFGKRFDMLMANAERWLMKRCVACAAAVSVRTLLASDTQFACPEEHWKTWFTTLGDKQMSILFNAPEGTSEWFITDVKAEVDLRAERELVTLRNKGEINDTTQYSTNR